MPRVGKGKWPRPAGRPPRLAAASGGGRLWIGRKPPDPSLSWWFLSRPAKAKLLELRLEGHPEMGGTPGQAPYWHIQEEGNTWSAVRGLFYLARAVQAWRPGGTSRFQSWLRE